MSDVDQLRAIFPDADPRVLSELLPVRRERQRAADALLADRPSRHLRALRADDRRGDDGRGRTRAPSLTTTFSAPHPAESGNRRQHHRPAQTAPGTAVTPVGVGVPVSVPLVPWVPDPNVTSGM